MIDIIDKCVLLPPRLTKRSFSTLDGQQTFILLVRILSTCFACCQLSSPSRRVQEVVLTLEQLVQHSISILSRVSSWVSDLNSDRRGQSVDWDLSLCFICYQLVAALYITLLKLLPSDHKVSKSENCSFYKVYKFCILMSVYRYSITGGDAHCQLCQW